MLVFGRENHMTDVLSVENMRLSDAATIEAGTPGRELMMRAARGVFDAVSEWKAPVAIVCGSGNNAGDGYALALLFREAGIPCSLLRTSDRFSDDGRYYYDKCMEAGIEDAPFDLDGFNTVVDCILGTGFKGSVRDDLSEVIGKINKSGAYIVSVDINSGLDGDTGMADTCVMSDITVSIGDFKSGHFLNMAKDVMKHKINCDIGIVPVKKPYHLIDESDVRSLLGVRKNFSNKGPYGYTALIGGSTRYSGAIRLACLANAAMRSGAGVVKVALPASLTHDVAQHILESTLFPLQDADVMSTNNMQIVYDPKATDELISNVKTVAFGMGIGTGDGARLMLGHLLANYSGTLIIDADGLTLLSQTDDQESVLAKREAPTVLTPHIKEFSRLCGLSVSQIQEDAIGTAVSYANRTGTIVLLKGPSTVITDGERVFLTDRGCAGMATAGSGDVLSGIAAATCAFMEDKCLATAAAAFINGAAGETAEKEYGDISMTAGDTAAAIPGIIMNLAD